jgi:hypothetical protein
MVSGLKVSHAACGIAEPVDRGAKVGRDVMPKTAVEHPCTS